MGSVRYRAHASAGPAWLKNLARSVGGGDPALVLCFGCWVEPRIGDRVELRYVPWQPLQPDDPLFSVVAIVESPDGDRLFQVEPVDPQSRSAGAEVRRGQIKVVGNWKGRTAHFDLHDLLP